MKTTLEVSGGERLKARLEEIARQAEKADIVKVGFLEGATYPANMKVAPKKGAKTKKGQKAKVGSAPLPVAAVAAFNEYGTGRIPARPFFRHMIRTQSPQWPAAISHILRAANYDTRVTLDAMGQVLVGQLQQSIRDWLVPPNAPYTIARKGFDKPLIETSHMLNSVSYVVLP